MKGVVNKITIRLVVLLLIASIGAMVVNNAVFTHSHKLLNGTVVTHAHPFDGSDDPAPFKTHHHTTTELFFFNHLEILFPLLFMFLSFFQPTLRNRFSRFNQVLIPARVIGNFRNRAPPVQ